MEFGLIIAILLTWFVAVSAILLGFFELKRKRKAKHI